MKEPIQFPKDNTNTEEKEISSINRFFDLSALIIFSLCPIIAIGLFLLICLFGLKFIVAFIL